MATLVFEHPEGVQNLGLHLLATPALALAGQEDFVDALTFLYVTRFTPGPSR